MSNSNGNAGLDKTNINWFITIYPRIEEKLDKIRDCKIYHLARLI